MSKRPKSSPASDAAKKRSLLARRYVVQLLTPKRSEGGVPVELMREPWDVQRQVLEALATNPRVRQQLVGEPLPKNLSALGAHGIQRTGPRFFYEVETELNWSLAILRYFRVYVDTFLVQKRSFERALLSGDIYRAQEVLEEHQSSLGVSLWYIDASLQAAERKGGSASNRALAKHFIDEAIVGTVQAFTALYSLRAERQTTLAFYDSEFRRIVDLDRLKTEAPETAFHLQFRAHRSGLTDFPDDMLGYNVAIDYEYALADRLQTFVKTIQVLVARTRQTAIPTWLEALVNRAAALFDDERLHAARLLVSGTVSDHRREFSSLLAEAMEEYTKGNCTFAIELSKKGIVSFADCFEFYELYCMCLLHLGMVPDLPQAQNAICMDLLRSERRDGEAVKSMAVLAKLATELDATRFGSCLESWVQARLPLAAGLDPIRWDVVNSSMPTPRAGLAVQRPKSPLDLLEEIARYSDMPVTIELFRRAIVGQRVMPETVPKDRALKYSGWAAERRGSYAEAVADYEQLLAHTSVGPRRDYFVREALYRCLFRLGEFARCVEIVVNEILSGEMIYFPAQVAPLANRLEKQVDFSICMLLAWPILAHRHMVSGSGRRDSHYVFAALDQFLAAHNVRRPSGLREINGEFETRQLVYFLRYVCVTDILDWSLDFTSPEDLDHERVAILDWLESIDPNNYTTYEEERAEVTRRIVLQKGLSEINRGKIYVDTTGVRQELGGTFMERVARYIVLRSSGGAIAELLPSFRVEGRRLYLAVSEDGRVMARDAFALFCPLQNEVLNCFLWSDHFGLDSSLSVEIRHGAVSGQLRPPFERAELITQRDSAEGRYAPNQTWLERASAAPDHVRGQMDWAFTSFSKKIDEIIESVKDRWIRIRIDDQNPDGLFDFRYSRLDLHEAWDRADTANDPEAFILSIFDDLWKRTRKNLDVVRVAIRTRLAEQLYSALATLESDIQSIYPALSPDIRRQVANCRIDLENELAVLEGWFAVDEVGAMSDYELPVLLETVLERVRRLPGIQEFSPQTTIKGQALLQGRTFRALYNVLYLVIENVIAHAREERNSAVISLTSESGLLRISVLNSVAKGRDIAELHAIAPELEARARGKIGVGSVRQEGKSGYYKLGKLLQSDLRRTQYSVRVDVTEERGFEVVIAFSLDGLVL